VGRLEALADRIGDLLNRHDAPEIALAQAKVLARATLIERDPRRCEAAACRIGEILERHSTAEIALEQVNALNSARTRLSRLEYRHDCDLVSRAAEIAERYKLTRTGFTTWELPSQNG
jgi:hypothetical protein